jgi:hypothetical protein
MYDLSALKASDKNLVSYIADLIILYTPSLKSGALGAYFLQRSLTMLANLCFCLDFFFFFLSRFFASAPAPAGLRW